MFWWDWPSSWGSEGGLVLQGGDSLLWGLGCYKASLPSWAFSGFSFMSKLSTSFSPWVLSPSDVAAPWCTSQPPGMASEKKFLLALRTELRTPCLPGSHCTAELYSRPQVIFSNKPLSLIYFAIAREYGLRQCTMQLLEGSFANFTKFFPPEMEKAPTVLMYETHGPGAESHTGYPILEFGWFRYDRYMWLKYVPIQSSFCLERLLGLKCKLFFQITFPLYSASTIIGLVHAWRRSMIVGTL